MVLRTLKYAVALLLLTISISGVAQQDAMFSQYFFNPLSLNPAYAGSRDAMSIGLISREQWIGVKGRPRTQSFFIHTPLKNQKLAAGLNILRDQAGPLVNTQISGDLAYRFEVTRKSRISIAIRATANMLSGELSSLEHTGVDPIFAQNVNYAMRPNVGAGAYWWSKRHFVGVGIPKIMENGIGFGDEVILELNERQHVFATAGFVFAQKKRRGLKFKPSILIKYVDLVPLQIDLAAHLMLKDRFWIGGVYRLNADISAVLGYQVTDQLRFGYAYDYQLGPIQQFSSGSHEIFVSFDFKFKNSNYMSPRYF